MNTIPKIKNSRAAAIIIHNGSLLLMYRKKDNKTYYAFPGGTVEPSEKPEETVLREVYEETSLQVNLGKLLYHIQIIDGQTSKDEYFYLCEYVAGVPKIQPCSIEQQRMQKGDNYYELQWVKLSDIEKLLVYPLEIRDWLVQDLKTGFKNKKKK